jgi:hypothetical protein
MGDEKKGRGLSVIQLLAGAVVLFTSPIIGTLNDQTFAFQQQYGKRAPFILFGVCGMTICLLFLSKGYYSTLTIDHSLFSYAFVYAILAGFSSICSVSFHGLVSDIGQDIPKTRISSLMAAVNLGGFFFGALIGLLSDVLGDDGLRFVIIVILLGFTGVSLFLVAEPQKNYASISSQVLVPKIPIWNKIYTFFRYETWEPFACKDFRLVFYARFLFQVSISTMQQVCTYLYNSTSIYNIGSVIALF